MNRNAIEVNPVNTADSALVVSLAPKVVSVRGKRGKLWDDPWRKQGHGDSLAANVLASYSSNSPKQDVSLGCGSGLSQDYL